MWRLLLCLVFANSVSASVLPNVQESFSIYETPENIMSHGYPAERHHVTTQDGYILEMHRIPGGKNRNENSDRVVVFLMHGLLSSSNTFIAIGPQNSIAYNLADAGFDVWMGNARGTKNSRNHTTLNPDDPDEKIQFFNFSFEEIGTLDVPAMVDYVLKVTGRKNLHYIGHSQGGTVFLVLTSMKPEYNSKFKSAHLLAGVGYQDHCPNTKIVNIAPFTDVIYSLSLRRGIVELYPPYNENAVNATIDQGRKLCSSDDSSNRVCKMLGMVESAMADNDREPTTVAGAAIKQLAHFGQTIRDKVFRRWNYGATDNAIIYGQSNPPEYDLSLITTNVTMHYTIGDTLLDEVDVLAMARDMPNTNVRKVPRDTFLHSDFTRAKDSKALVTDYIINAILCAENDIAACNMLSGSSSRVAVSTIILKTCFVLFFSRILYTA